jgi:hypothetical protein
VVKVVPSILALEAEQELAEGVEKLVDSVKVSPIDVFAENRLSQATFA